MNRLTRDQILIRALDMVDSPTLDQKDRPSGTIVAGALSIGWLQDGLDYFIHRFPFGGTLTSAAFNLVAGDGSKPLPNDYILDYQDGVTYQLPDTGRLHRRGYNVIVDFNANTATRGKPRLYAITGTNIYFRPIADKAYSLVLTYYALSGALQAGTIPNFPSDLVLVRYVYLRGLEWVRAVPQGSAEQYALTVIADLQKSGIGMEQESDRIPFDRTAFPGDRSGWGNDPTAWMGDPVA